MAFNINGIIIKDKLDYIQKGKRRRINSTMRNDLYNDFDQLMKQLGKSNSIGFDVFVEMLNDDKILHDFVNRVVKY